MSGQRTLARSIWITVLSALSIVAVRVANAGEPDVPHGVGPLPDFSKGARGGAVVNHEHLPSYRSILPKEVADLVQQGELVFEVARNPREPMRFVKVPDSQGAGVQVTNDGELRGLPATTLPSPIFTLGDYSGGDSKQFAYKALWNTAAAMWRYPVFDVGFSAYIFPKATADPHKLEFQLQRIYPRLLGGMPGTLPPLFREKISARKPKAIQRLAWLTLRFFGAGEDFVWVASPVNRRIRQMTSSNRSDSLFSGVFTPDDLLVWSGKVESVEPVSVVQLPMLVPLFEGKEAAPVTRDTCSERSFLADSAVALNHQSSRFKSAARWIPTNTLMTLRNVWRIELVSRDPFSNDSRSALYVDQSTGLPVYRVVWDSSGRLRKVSIGIIRVLESGEKEKAPIVAGQIIIFVNEERRLVLISDRFTECKQYSKGLTLNDFDPNHFATFDAAPEPQKRVEERVESEDSSD